MFKSTTHIRVRYGEVDQMGYVYYGNYALYYEVARAEAIRQLGYTYKQMENEGIVMPVIKVDSKYIKAAKYDDLIEVETIIKEISPLPFMTFHHKFYNAEKELIHKAVVTLAFYNPKTQLKTKIPMQLAEKMNPFF